MRPLENSKTCCIAASAAITKTLDSGVLLQMLNASVTVFVNCGVLLKIAVSDLYSLLVYISDKVLVSK